MKTLNQNDINKLLGWRQVYFDPIEKKYIGVTKAGHVLMLTLEEIMKLIHKTTDRH